MTIGCNLDEHGCISLLAVLRIMNQVNQEQTWALAYEVAALMQRLWPAGNCAIIESLAQIHLHREGYVHEKSLAGPLASARRPRAAEPSSDGDDDCEPSGADHAADHEDSASDSASSATNRSDASETTKKKKKKKMMMKKPRTTSNLQRSHHLEPIGGRLADSECCADTEKQDLPPTPPITPELKASQRQLTDTIGPKQGSAGTRLQVATNEAELVASLGIALFWALDYGIPDDEERKLSLSMEYLIVQSQNELGLDELVEICIKRLPVATKQQADLHYRQVCNSLIQDTIELSMFLDKIYTASMVLSDFTNLSDNCCPPPPIGDKTNNNNNNKPPTITANSNTKNNISTVSRISDSTANENNISENCDILNHHQLLNQNHLLHHHHHHHHYPLDHLERDELSQLGLPLASLRALKINDWARLWMQVIRELRQLGKFKQ